MLFGNGYGNVCGYRLVFDFIAIHYLYSMPRGYRSRHRDTHEIMLSVSVSGFRVSRLATPNTILNSVLKILCVWIDVTWSSWRVVLEERSWSALGRGLGSGTVHIAGAVKHWFVRFAWLVSCTRRPEAFWGFRFYNWPTRPSPVTRYNQIIRVVRLPRTPTIQWTSLPHLRTRGWNRRHCYAATYFMY